MTRLLALFLDRFGPAHRSGDMHPIEALHWMTHNHWNLEDAVADAIRGTDSDLGSSDGLEDLEEEIVPPVSIPRTCISIYPHTDLHLRCETNLAIYQ